MGASNALAAYMRCAGEVPPLAMQCLVYMALVSKDSDERPWYGQGHAALAEHALGRPNPITDSDLRAVRRAITPLLQANVIQADRPASGRRDGPVTVRYRLNLSLSVGRKASDAEPRKAADRRTETVRIVGRKTDQRRTKSVPAQDEIRPPKEEEEYEEREEEELAGLPTQVQTARAGTCDDCGTYLEPDGQCFACRRTSKRTRPRAVRPTCPTHETYLEGDGTCSQCRTPRRNAS